MPGCPKAWAGTACGCAVGEHRPIGTQQCAWEGGMGLLCFLGLSPSREASALAPWAPSHLSHLLGPPEWHLAAELPPAHQQGLVNNRKTRLNALAMSEGVEFTRFPLKHEAFMEIGTSIIYWPQFTKFNKNPLTWHSSEL